MIVATSIVGRRAEDLGVLAVAGERAPEKPVGTRQDRAAPQAGAPGGTRGRTLTSGGGGGGGEPPGPGLAGGEEGDVAASAGLDVQRGGPAAPDRLVVGMRRDHE